MYRVRTIQSLSKLNLLMPSLIQKRWKIDKNEKRGMPEIFKREPIETEDPEDMIKSKITGIYEEDGNIFKRPGCQLCWQGLDTFTYRDVLLISQFISPIGRIYDRHETGICKRMQMKLREEVKKARNIGLLPKAMTPQQIDELKRLKNNV